MTSDQSALLAAILADPADDTARLVYADWLDENGHQERAAFIRVQVELSRWPGCDWTERRKAAGYKSCSDWNSSLTKGSMSSWCPSCISRTALRARERELWHQLPTCKEFAPWASGISTDPDRTRFWVGNQSGPLLEVTRGFVSRITCTDWLRHADSLHWRPGATMECPECRGYGGEDKYLPDDPGNNLMHGPHWYPCRSELCNKGLVPRPMPPGAQPIERVVLTTVPEEFGASVQWESVNYGIGTEFRCDRWPGIVFEVRPGRSLNFNDIQALVNTTLADLGPMRFSELSADLQEQAVIRQNLTRRYTTDFDPDVRVRPRGSI